MPAQVKVYCRYCQHCMKVASYTDKTGLDKLTCRHNPSIIDSFYSPKYQYHYCSEKNKNNDCIFFEDNAPILEEFSRAIDAACGTVDRVTRATMEREVEVIPPEEVPEEIKLTILQRIKRWLSVSSGS